MGGSPSGEVGTSFDGGDAHRPEVWQLLGTPLGLALLLIRAAAGSRRGWWVLGAGLGGRCGEGDVLSGRRVLVLSPLFCLICSDPC